MRTQAHLTIDQAFHLGVARQRAGDLAGATELFDHVLARRPEHPEAMLLLGVIAYQQRRYDAALGWLQRAAAVRPDQAAAHGNLGLVLDALGRFEEAIAACHRAIVLRPTDPNLHYNLANALHHAGQPEEAVMACRGALALRPDHAGALNNLANLLREQGDLDGCIAAFNRARAARPDDPGVGSNRLLSMQYHPALDQAWLADEHRRWGARHAGPAAAAAPSPLGPMAWPNFVDPDRRLRVGYVSADFRDHAVARFLLPLLANHDPDAVQVFAYSQVNPPDAVTEQFRARVSGWRDVAHLSDAAVAAQVRGDQIDILVDLSGHTAGNRLPVFAHQPAPIQATYLGYPGTTGLGEVDYRLTDLIADPPGRTERLHAETLLGIGGCAWCFQPPADVPVAERGPGPITFGSFNALVKLNEPTVQLWGEVFRAVPASRLLLKSDGLGYPTVQRRVGEQFARAGIGPDRLALHGRAPAYADHLALYGQVDVALDTFPYNGTTTTCEAMWMGVPVVTRIGDRHAARVGLSLLTQVGLADLAGTAPEEFVRIAVALADDRPRLAALRASLRERMRASRLMDAAAHAAAVEDAYRTMWRTWCAARR